MAQRPKSRSAPGEAALEAVTLEEVDQLPCILYEPGLNMVAALRWVVSVEISGEDKASAPVVILEGILYRVLDS